MKLADKTCKAAKPKDKAYKLSDGGGLYLQINPTGSKYWRLKYRFGGKEKTLAIGVYPLVTLAARGISVKPRKSSFWRGRPIRCQAGRKAATGLKCGKHF